MAVKVYARHGGAAAASTDDITARIPAFSGFGAGAGPLIQMGMSVQNGGASAGKIIVPDPTANDDASLYFPPFTQITLTEDASGDELWLAQGRISGWEIGRADVQPPGDDVQWNLTIDDANVDLRDLAFTEDWVRPAESGVERLYALAAYTLNGTSSTRPDYGGVITYRPSTTIVISDSHLAPDSETTAMPAKTYPSGTDPMEVANDIATTEGKVYGVVPHHVGGVSHLCMLYVKESDHTTYVSTVKVSDDPADWDPDDLAAPVFAPIWDQGNGQRVDGNANISGLVSRYGPNDAVVISVSDTLGDDNEYRIASYQDGASVSSGQAAARAASIIAYRSPYSETDAFSLDVLPEQAHLITAGMSIQVKAAPINAGTISTVGTYVDRRIVDLQWEPRETGIHHAILSLNRPTGRGLSAGAVQPAATSPTGAPNCDETSPYQLALLVDGGDWTKQNDPDYPVPGPSLPEYRSVNVDAVGESAVLTQSLYGNFDFSPFGFQDWYTGGSALNDVYTAAAPEEMMWRFKWTLLGTGENIRMHFMNGTGSGAVITVPDVAGDPNDGYIWAFPNVDGAVEFAWVVDTEYFIRWRAGSVKVWEVGDPEPGSFTASGGATSGTGQVQFFLYPSNNPWVSFTPSTIEVQRLTIFELTADPFCLTDPGDSPFFAKSDDPRFDTIVTDHGGLSGLADDDHTQYIKDAEFTAKGDLLAGTGSGTFDNLTVGSNGKVLSANSAMSTGLEWVTATGGGGPFELVTAGTWKFISGANTVMNDDYLSGSSYVYLDVNHFEAGAVGDSLIMDGLKAIFVTAAGLVIPVLSADPSGGDSENGQIYYDSSTDTFRAYQNGAWVDLIGGGSHTHVYSEVPSGTINGSNDTFTLAATPASGTLRLYKNGLRQRAGSGNDYTLATDTITYESGNIPQSGDSHVADYET